MVYVMKELVITKPGKIVRREGGIMLITKDGEKVVISNEYDVVIIANSKVSITSAAMRIMARLGIDLVILEWNGEVVYRASLPLPNKTAETRLAQYKVILEGKSLMYAKSIIRKKIIEQGRALRYLAKGRRLKWLRDASYQLEKYVLDVDSSNDEDELRAVEAMASRLFWDLLSKVFPEFKGRDPESKDKYNITLNYTYGILYARCAKALTVTGLDIYAGLFHTLKSGKSSLVFDFSEMFKPRLTIAVFTKVDFSKIKGNDYLDYDSRREIANVVIKELDSMDSIIKREAWNLASALRKEEPYVPGW